MSGLLLGLVVYVGCASPASTVPTVPEPRVSLSAPRSVQKETAPVIVRQTPPPNRVTMTLNDLLIDALQSHPRIQSLDQQVQAAWAKAPLVRNLPDPAVGLSVFGNPIETAAGSQQAILSFRQHVPSLKRLRAQEQQAAITASALEQSLRSERLRIVAEVRSGWAQLWLLDRQIRVNQANQTILESIIKVELTRAGTAGRKTAVNDTLRASLERTRLEESLVRLKQARASLAAQINELLNRPPQMDLPTPKETDLLLSSPSASLQGLSEIAINNQPEIIAATVRAEAARLGIDVAWLQRIPEVTLSANWFFTDDNRPSTRIVDVGRDAWSVGAMINVPLWHRKYDAIESEARHRHGASLADVETLRRRYDAVLADLLEQAKAAQQSRRIYEKAILPQAQQTFRMDRQALGTGALEFDRVMTDLRNLITLEVELYRVQANLATIHARLEQTLGVPLHLMNQSQQDHSNEKRQQPASPKEAP